MWGLRAGCGVVAAALFVNVAAAAPMQAPSGARYSAELGGDPLQDPAWHENARSLQITTGVFGAVAGASLVSFVGVSLAPSNGCSDCPGPISQPTRADHMRAEAAAGLGVVFGLSLLGLIISGAMYDRHLDRGVLWRPRPEFAPLADVRADQRWFTRDRRLTRGMRLTAAFAGIGGGAGTVCWVLLGDGGGLFGAALGLTLFSGVNLVALAVQAKVRQKHRRGLVGWPPLAAGGLTFQF